MSTKGIVCTDDFDCANAQVCYTNVTWKPSENGFCECNTWYGYEGDDCKSLGITAIIMVSFLAIQSLIGTVAFCYGARDLYRYLSVVKRLELNSSIITLVSVTLSCGLFVFWQILILISHLDPDSNSVQLRTGPEKYTTWSIIQRPVIFFTEVLTVIAAVNVSVLWIELAYSSKRMKNKVVNKISYYRKAVLVFEIIFAIVMAIFAALGLWAQSFLALLPFMLILNTVFLIGRTKMVSVLNVALSMDPNTRSSDDSPNETSRGKGRSRFKKSKVEKNSAERTRRTIVAIQRCSKHVIIAFTGIFITGIAYFFMETKYGWKELAPYGKISWVTVVNNSPSIFVNYALLAILHYSHRNIGKMTRFKRQQLSQMQTNTNTNDDNYNGDITNSQINTNIVSTTGPLSI